jgi:hypothetical protein
VNVCCSMPAIWSAKSRGRARIFLNLALKGQHSTAVAVNRQWRIASCPRCPPAAGADRTGSATGNGCGHTADG